MSSLTVTTRGQVTLREKILRHTGIRPGEKLTPGNSWRDLEGFLGGKTNGVRLSTEDIREAIADSGAAAGLGEP